MTLPIATAGKRSHALVPEGDALLREIDRLRRQLDAVILAHYCLCICGHSVKRRRRCALLSFVSGEFLRRVFMKH